jgi:hypothetical protein
VCRSAKLLTTQFMCNLAFKRRYVTPSDRAGHIHRSKSAELSIPQRQLLFLMFASSPTTSSPTSLTSPFPHSYILPSSPMFSHPLSCVSVYTHLQYNVPVVVSSKYLYLCDFIHLLLTKQFNKPLC